MTSLFPRSNPLRFSRSVLNVSSGGPWNPKLALLVNSLWPKIKAQNFAGQVLSKHNFSICRKRGSDFFNLVPLQDWWIKQDHLIVFYYMASSVCGQDEPNHALWLAAILPAPWSRSRIHIINPLLNKPVRSRWLDIGLVLFLRVYWPRLRLGL